MKKLSKRSIALITVVALLGATILTLGLIRVKPDKYFFSDYKYFQVFNLSESAPFASIEEQVAPKLSSVNFSVLGAILEGQGGFKPTMVKDDEGEPRYLTAANVLGMASTSERYLLHFVYKDIRTITVDGIDYEYNRAYILLPEGDGEIVDVKAVPYVFERVHNDSDGTNSSDLYKIADLTIKMRTSKLYVAIQNAIEEVKS